MDGLSSAGRLAADGYLLLRGLLPAEAVLAVRAAVTGALAGVGWLADGTHPLDAVPGPGFQPEQAAITDEYFSGYEAVQRLQAFHELAHDPALVAMAAGLLGVEPGAVLVHPRKIFRASPPGDALRTPAHQDHRLIQGTVDVLTMWIPLGDCPVQLGGLAVLAGSAGEGLRPIRPAPGVGGVVIDGEDALEQDPRWRHAPMAAGDVLLFHALTVHEARPNRTDRLRLSVDFRYQRATDPVAEGSLKPHWFPRLPDHDELCRGWTSTAAVAVPPGVAVAAPFDAFDPALATPRSTLIAQ